jgi:hypothetical protein
LLTLFVTLFPFCNGTNLQIKIDLSHLCHSKNNEALDAHHIQGRSQSTIMCKYFIMLWCCLMAHIGFTQNFQLHGSVADQQTGEPLVGAVVRAVPQGVYDVVGLDGNFRIKGLKKELIPSK